MSASRQRLDERPHGDARGALDAQLAALVGDGRASAAAGLVLRGGERLWAGVAGEAAPGEPATLATRFDLASLTKPFTATLALVLDAGGTLPLRTRVGDLWPAAAPAFARRPLGSLLRHRSGLVAWTPLGARCATPGAVGDLLTGGELVGAPPGTYSDLGYVLYGLAAERAGGFPLDALLADRVLRPLGLAATGYGPGAVAGVAACHLLDVREVELAAAQGIALAPLGAPARGEVQDGNARFLGGVAGHAGLFATAADVAALVRAWAAAKEAGLLREEAVAAALRGRPRPLGWAPRRVRGSAGPALGRRSFGHVGFTGGSVWHDPDRDLTIVLLAHRNRVDVALEGWRRGAHALAVRLASGGAKDANVRPVR